MSHVACRRCLLGCFLWQDKKRACRAHLYRVRDWIPSSFMGSHTQASFIIKIWIGEVKVSMKFTVVEFHGDGVMGILIDSPDEPGQIEAWIW